MIKSPHKDRALELRRAGMTYREIREQLQVAKSTLSLWFREVELSKPQIQRITEKKKQAQIRGAESRRQQRIQTMQIIRDQSLADVKALSDSEKWLIGVMLYWAEGSKERAGRWGSQIQFANSDPRMALLFKRWLTDVIKIDPSRLKYEIYIHRNHKHRLDVVRSYWADMLQTTTDHFESVYFKRHNPKTNRKNQGNEYYGLVRIRVRSSSTLNRKISGWIEGVVKNWGMV